VISIQCFLRIVRRLIRVQSFAYSHLACEFSDESPEPIGQLVYRPVSRLHRPSWDTCYPALQDWLHARSYGTAEEGRSLARVERALLRSLDPLCSSAVHHSSMRGVRSRSLRFHVIKVMNVTEDIFFNSMPAATHQRFRICKVQPTFQIPYRRPRRSCI
jgi:hypothetical protein